MFFDNSGELQAAPATVINFDIVVAPAGVGLVRPTLLVEAAENGGHQHQTVKALLGPILDFAQRLLAVAQRDRFERLARGERRGLEH